MARVWIPWAKRALIGGQPTVDAPGKTIGEVVDALERAHPGVKARLCPCGKLDPHLSISVDGRMTRLGLGQPVPAECEIRFFPMIEGG